MKTIKAPVLYPSARPVGSGTLTVTYSGQTSAPVAIDVVANTYGNFAINQAGSGPGVITNANHQALSFTNAANPGEPMILWGTGLGPVTGDENAGPLPGNMPSVPVKLYVGNQQATITYQGRSGCCVGVDQIAFHVPSNVSGCAVPVAVQTGNTVSNFVSMPIAASAQITPFSRPRRLLSLPQREVSPLAASACSGTPVAFPGGQRPRTAPGAYSRGTASAISNSTSPTCLCTRWERARCLRSREAK